LKELTNAYSRDCGVLDDEQYAEAKRLQVQLCSDLRSTLPQSDADVNTDVCDALLTIAEIYRVKTKANDRTLVDALSKLKTDFIKGCNGIVAVSSQR
jgi:hypothetical protein